MRATDICIAIVAYVFLLTGLGGCSPSAAPPAINPAETKPAAAAAKEIAPPARAADPAPTAPSTKPQAGMINPAYVCAELHFALAIRPQGILASPLLPLVPERARDEFFSEFKRAGLEVKDLEQILLLAAEAPVPHGREIKPGDPPPAPPKIGAILRFHQRFEPRQLVSKMYQANVPPKVTAGGEYFSHPRGEQPSIFCPDKKTMVVSMEPLLSQMIAAREGTGSLAALLRTVSANHDAVGVVEIQGPIKEMLSGAAKQGGDALPPLRGASALPQQIKNLVVTADLNGDSLLTFSIAGNDEAGAKGVESQAMAGRDFAKEMFTQARPEIQKNMPAELAGPLLGMVDEMLAGLAIQRTGATVAIDLKAPASWKDLPKTLAPLIEQARQQEVKNARLYRLNRVRTAALSFQMHNSGGAQMSLLEDIKDGNGKPILSWRVRLLPYLDGPPGGIQIPFRLNEPWDSEHNLKLVSQMPAIFGDSKQGLTSIFMFVRDGKVLSNYMSIGDSSKLMAVEAGTDKAIPWTKPGDLPVVDANPASVLGTIPGGKFPAAFYDGHVAEMDANMEPAQLLAIILPERMPEKGNPSNAVGANDAATDRPAAPSGNSGAQAPRQQMLRTWTDAKGRKVEARLLAVEGDTVRLEKPDGKPIAVPLSRLSQEDQDYAKSAFK